MKRLGVIRACMPLVLLFGFSQILAGQEPTQVDLDLTLAGATLTEPVDQKLNVCVAYFVTGKSYTISATPRAVEIPAFSLDILKGATTASEIASFKAATPCGTAVADLQAAVDAATTEQAVKAAFLKSVANNKSCEKDLKKVVQQCVEYTLQRGEELVVEVKRTGATSEDKKDWSFILTTGPKGRWLTYYGFSFLRNRDRSFFLEPKTAPASQSGDSKADPDEAKTTYTIREKTRQGGYTNEPSIVFSYVPAMFQFSSYVPALSAGLGVDLDNPIVFAGFSFLVGDNVNLFIGGAVHRETRLDGQFKVGGEVTENLTSDKLTEKVFQANLIFGVGFRFNSNPFKKSTGTDTTGAKK